MASFSLASLPSLTLHCIDTGGISPPVLEKKPVYVAYGDVKDKNRGENPMPNVVYLKVNPKRETRERRN